MYAWKAGRPEYARELAKRLEPGRGDGFVVVVGGMDDGSLLDGARGRGTGGSSPVAPRPSPNAQHVEGALGALGNVARLTRCIRVWVDSSTIISSYIVVVQTPKIIIAVGKQLAMTSVRRSLPTTKVPQSSIPRGGGSGLGPAKTRLASSIQSTNLASGQQEPCGQRSDIPPVGVDVQDRPPT